LVYQKGSRAGQSETSRALQVAQPTASFSLGALLNVNRPIN